MTKVLNEDDIYRTSTQYRLWSFSPEQLTAQRRKTHDLALHRARQYAGKAGDVQNATANGTHVEHLTEEEELRLVQRYCNLIRTTSDHLSWPNNVKATAVQYLKRFYLSNSCMTYPPKEIYKTVLYLASKTEAIHVTVSNFAHRISADPDTILAPEYKVMQALRFTLDVRQPSRGLKGVLMEMLNIAADTAVHASPVNGEAGSRAHERTQNLPPPPDSCKTPWRPPRDDAPLSPKQLADRIQVAYTAARDLLDAPACLTDAYFLFTPSQILLAAMQLADEPLYDVYMENKLPISMHLRPKILATIRDCSTMIAAFDPNKIMSKDEGKELEKKLERCRDPTTIDLVKNHAAMKRSGAEDGKLDEKDAKRRKLEREKNNKEMDDLFGPGLPKAKGNG